MATIERFGPTRRGGPVFRWLGEPLAIDLANTVMVLSEDGEAVDLLSSSAELALWLEGEEGRLDGRGARPGDLGAIRELRDAVRDLLAARANGAKLPPRALAIVNAASEAAPAAPVLEIGEGGPRRFDRPAGGGTRQRLLGVLARAAIELLSSAEAEKLRICRAPSCGMFYLGNRRWCCSACGNRARAARHYERSRATRAA